MTNPMHAQVIDAVAATQGWTSLDRCLEMFDLIIEHKPKVVVEIGVYGGRTLIPQALALREVGAGHVYGIDPWRTEAALEGENEANREWWRRLDMEEFHRQTMGHIWRLELDKWCSVIRAPSQYVAELFTEESAVYDTAAVIGLINIDGNHSEIASVRDAQLWLPRVKPGGLVVIDDLNWPSTQKMVAIVRENCESVKDAGDHGIFKKK